MRGPSARACATSARTPTPGRSGRRSTCCCASSPPAPASRGVQAGRRRSAGPACSATSASARRRASAGSAPRSTARIVEDFCDFLAGQTDAVPAPAREGDAGGRRRPGVRARRPAARRPRGAAPGDGEERRRARATAPTPTSSASPRTSSRPPSRSSTCAAGGSAGSAGWSWTRSRTSRTGGLVERFLEQFYGAAHRRGGRAARGARAGAARRRRRRRPRSCSDAAAPGSTCGCRSAATRSR